MDSYGLKVRSQTRDDDEYYYFDILSTENNHIGAFAVLKKEARYILPIVMTLLYLLSKHYILPLKWTSKKKTKQKYI